MLTAIEHSFLRVFPQKYRNRHWKKNLPIRRFQPSKIRGKAIICALGAYGLKNRGKLQPNLFLPPFCRMLGQCGIATSCITDFRSLGQELEISEGVPTVLISLIHETYDDLDEYDIPEDLLKQANAIFNSHRTAGIIRDKRKANETLSRQGIMMPSLRIDEGKKIFSNARVGTGENAFVLEKLQEIDDGRYNAELIDTRVPFENSVYFTCVRLVCIGTRTLQIYVRARDVEENNPSVHSKDTPKNPELLEHLYGNLVAPRLEELHALGNRIGRALGPGFLLTAWPRTAAVQGAGRAKAYRSRATPGRPADPPFPRLKAPIS